MLGNGIIKLTKKELQLFLLNIILPTLLLFVYSCTNSKKVYSKKIQLSNHFNQKDWLKAYKTNSPLLVDGYSNDFIWDNIPWYDMNNVWMGQTVDSLDYYGQFKLAWDREYLYVLVKVIDDYLQPTLKDGIENYWKGDYVEVFIDEDLSGGNHQYNHQAFAYHVSTEGHAIDLSTSKKAIFLDDHVSVKRSTKENVYTWEMAIKLFDNQFNELDSSIVPVTIYNNKRIGFSIAYGDNDGKQVRENFMGSKKTHGKNNDEGYVNSDVFGTLIFVNDLPD